MPIENVSDTARWVAFYRAMETERPDALFRDPYARALAGPEGERIVKEMPRGRASSWAMITRTVVFDEIILDVVRRHDIDMVLNLAAGLDARPWRLKLPASLRWVDVDLPAMLDYKARRHGRTFARVDRWLPSTRACSVCGVIGEAKPLHVREWTCPCGAVHDRDVNAARNILAAGRTDRPTLVELVSAGAPVPQPAVKREPAGSTA